MALPRQESWRLASHGIVRRHPDVPVEAQWIMGRLSVGHTWTGYVKNRCKMAVPTGGSDAACPEWQVVGYMYPVRRKADRARIEKA